MQHDLALRASARQDGVFTIHLAGVIDAHTLDKFEAGLGKAVEKGAKSLLLDCEEIRYVNSAGFGELIRYHDRLKERGGTLVLARVPPKVGVILEMLGLKSLIPLATSVEQGLRIAAKGAEADPIVAAPTARIPVSKPGMTPLGQAQTATPLSATATASRLSTQPPPSRIHVNRPILTTDERTVVCAFCDTRMRIGGSGRWACPACGAPFSATKEGGVAFDWSRADAEAMHLTFDVSARTLAGFAGVLEGILVERRVSHARMRRFAREAAHVCHLIGEHAFERGRRGPIHVLALAGPQRLHLRIVDRGRSLSDQIAKVFSTQARLFLDFRYSSPIDNINLTEFAFAYAGSGVFVS